MTTFSQNTAAHLCLLPDRACLQVTGEDRVDFLQGLVTNDVAGFGVGEARFAALLTPQGKILFDFLFVNAGDAILIDCAKDVVSDLAKRLGFYKLRAKVSIEDVSETKRVAAAWGAEAGAVAEATGAISYADPRLGDLGLRLILNREHETHLFTAGAPDYDAMRIGLAVPEGGKDYAFGTTFPHDACLDLLHGVDFKKGCYVGQEVVSRMQHRGTGRTRVLKASGEAALPGDGIDITSEGFPVGRLGSVSGTSGVALCRIDRVADAMTKGQQFLAGGVPVFLSVPIWANFTLEPAAS